MKKIAKVLVGLFVIMVLLSMCSAWGDDDEQVKNRQRKRYKKQKKTCKEKECKKTEGYNGINRSRSRKA